VSDRIVPLEPEFPSDVVSGRAICIIDDGRVPNRISRFFGSARPESSRVSPVADIQPRPSRTSLPENAFELCFFRVNLPMEFKFQAIQMEQLIQSLINSLDFIAYEIIGNEFELYFQFVAAERQSDVLARQLRVHFPEFDIRSAPDGLGEVDNIKMSDNSIVVPFGLADHWFRPIPTGQELGVDPFVPLVGALNGLRSGEIACVQVIFGRTRYPWQRSVRERLFDNQGKASYAGLTDQLKAIRQKLSDPLAAVNVRLWVNSADRSSSGQIARQIMPYFKQFGVISRNSLVPLRTIDPGASDGAENILARTSHRSGILLTVPELTSLIRFPGDAVRSSKLKRHAKREKRAPQVTSRGSVVLGRNPYQNEDNEVRLSREQRTRHMHVIGSSGSGKTTLLLSLIKADLDNNDGVCVVDPHGDLIDAVMENIPDHRLRDVVLFDPSDAEYPIGFNILHANSPLEKTILSSDLVATFRRMATSWGDVMDAVAANAILAFLESSRGGTLFDLRRFLVEKNFREDFLKTVTDDAVRYFWEHEFQLIAGKPQASILIRLDMFLRQSLIRNIVCQKENRLDFRRLMDEKKILLVKLSQGLIGEENAYLLGTMILSRIYQSALSRQDSRERPYWWVSADEFHHLITPSMERILSGARKYNLGLILAHQEFKQLQTRSQEVASSVMSNCYTRVCFRLGDADAEKFAGGFSSFDARALQNLGVGEAIARVERADYDFNLTVEAVPTVDPAAAKDRVNAIREFSRNAYGRPRGEVEEEFKVMRAKVESAERTTKASEPKRKPLAINGSFADKSAIDREREQEVETDGGGNGEHAYLQKIVKRISEKYGFIATIEKQVFGGVGRIDVALENGAIKVACEVAVTNTVEYEVQSIQKCLSSGYDRVIVLSVNEQHLNEIEGLAASTIGADKIGAVAFLKPHDFHLYLERLCSENPDVSGDAKVQGYKIHTSYAESTRSAAELIKGTIAEILGSEVSK
ncbi:MAG TPA: type IV secretion system DNA-binding domain-containing protein, partial [Pyrinomonadaceae bacterium]|nr:type IV secretion system DNA-binding domain-containing protein [Pyrinomonadaceae bacterium]